MSPSIGVNLRVTGHSHQGGRKYMEDIFSVAYQSTADEKDLEYAFFGIFDGHGGREAAQYAKDHLMDLIVKQKNFWSDRDEDVLRAITDGFVATHNAMWSVVETWPKTSSGLPSTSGTTASVAFIRRGRIYIGHVGDSGIVLGCSDDREEEWKAMPLTNDHKPECEKESRRIHDAGGKVVNKMGVPRVVWNRPKPGHKGPIRRSTPFDEVPFLAVARALGDLWSHNQEQDSFVVSPVPDVHVLAADASKHRCLVLGTDGLWNVMTPQQAVQIVQQTERFNESCYEESQESWINPSHCLVERALQQWANLRMRADNTSVVTLMLDPPGPPRFQVRQQKGRLATTSPAHRRDRNTLMEDPEESAEDLDVLQDSPLDSPPLTPEAAPPNQESAVLTNTTVPLLNSKEPLPSKTVRGAVLPEDGKAKKRHLHPADSVPAKRRLGLGENRGRPEKGTKSLPLVQRELRSSSVPLRKRLRPSIAVK
ncbi:protein phosphatase 1D-like [Neocloeon triangulifer]|uniref:protein phosphatase 1D-like n=1 Tax=Neocloeon triangulifer TaxID=2078957 RepID=UPI00286ED0EF|nr:protein phosphatase 1D-like [Neocloeon triangulifer]